MLQRLSGDSGLRHILSSHLKWQKFLLVVVTTTTRIHVGIFRTIANDLHGKIMDS